MQTETTKRRRGGQPGNTNALKHGYYAQKRPLPGPTGPENPPASGVDREAEVLRSFIHRVFELTAGVDDLPLDQAVRLLRVLALSVTSLSTLLRGRQILHQPPAASFPRALPPTQTPFDPNRF